MRERMGQVIDDFRQTAGDAAQEEATEVREFLRWMHDNRKRSTALDMASDGSSGHGMR